jgi:hypothetical protein
VRLEEIGMTTALHLRGHDKEGQSWFTPTQERQVAMSTRLITMWRRIEDISLNT